jgi:hypothetical protein
LVVTIGDRVDSAREDNRNRRGRRLRGQCRSTRRREDHGRLTANEIGRQCRQSIVLAVRPAVFDGYVPALDKAGFAQALVKREQAARRQRRRFAAKEPDHRHHCLLRARRKRPRSRRAAEKRNEIASFHFAP